MKLIQWISDLFNRDENIELDFNRDESRICIIGNIVDKRYHGELKEIKRGTKHFTPNTKVYCFPKYPGMAHESIEVMGVPRKSKKLITITIASNRIKNFRLKSVYKQAIIEQIDENYLYNTWKMENPKRKEINSFLKHLNSMTEEIDE